MWASGSVETLRRREDSLALAVNGTTIIWLSRPWSLPTALSWIFLLQERQSKVTRLVALLVRILLTSIRRLKRERQSDGGSASG
jgi:hypothetical protein